MHNSVPCETCVRVRIEMIARENQTEDEDDKDDEKPEREEEEQGEETEFEEKEEEEEGTREWTPIPSITLQQLLKE
jgi:hypothetical protein